MRKKRRVCPSLEVNRETGLPPTVFAIFAIFAVFAIFAIFLRSFKFMDFDIYKEELIDE